MEDAMEEDGGGRSQGGAAVGRTPRELGRTAVLPEEEDVGGGRLLEDKHNVKKDEWRRKLVSLVHHEGRVCKYIFAARPIFWR